LSYTRNYSSSRDFAGFHPSNTLKNVRGRTLLRLEQWEV